MCLLSESMNILINSTAIAVIFMAHFFSSFSWQNSEQCLFILMAMEQTDVLP